MKNRLICLHMNTRSTMNKMTALEASICYMIPVELSLQTPGQQKKLINLFRIILRFLQMNI